MDILGAIMYILGANMEI